MVLDYSTTCGACSTPLDSPPRDGPDSMCAYLHTKQGRADFEAILGRDSVTRAVTESVPAVTQPPEVVTETENGDPEVVTLDDDHPLLAVTDETKQQRYRRLNRERINERERDRRS